MGWEVSGDTLKFYAEPRPLQYIAGTIGTLPSISQSSLSGIGEEYYIDVDVSGISGPGDFVTPATAWGNYTIAVESAPNLHVSSAGKQSFADLPTEVTSDITVPADNGESFDETQPEYQTYSIPKVPDITLGVYAQDIPELSVTAPDSIIDWMYEQYTSDLLTSLRLVDMDYSTTGIVERDRVIWDSPPMFLSARGMSSFGKRYEDDKALFSQNITRMIAVLERTPRDRRYIENMQILENLDRAIHDEREKSNFAFAKAFADNQIDNCRSVVAVWNGLISQYSALSLVFEDNLANENAKLAKYKTEVVAEQKKGVVNDLLMKKYLNQIESVNMMARSYELTMKVSETIANIVLLKAKLTALNAESFVMRTNILTKQIDTNMYYNQTELKKKDLLDAAIEETKTDLENANLNIQLEIEEIENEIDVLRNETEYLDIKQTYETLLARAGLFETTANLDIDFAETRGEDEVAGINRQTDKAEARGDMQLDNLSSKRGMANLRNLHNVDISFDKIRLGEEADEHGNQDLYKSHAAAAKIMAEANTQMILNQTIAEAP